MTSCDPKDPVQRNIQSWIRAFHILFNFILSLLGKGGLTVSILAKLGLFNELRLLEHYQNINANIFLSCSVILIAIGWLGIFAGLKNSRTSTIANGIILGGFLLGTTAYVATIAVNTNYTLTSHLYKHIKNDMYYYYQNRDIRDIIDILQTTLSCCGLDGVNTWNNNTIPKSCCRKILNQTKCGLDSFYLQTNGCFEEFIRISRYYVWLLFAVLIFSGLFEIFGIILSRLQCRIIKDTRRKKLVKESLKIPRPHVTSTEECEIQNNEEKKDGEKMNENKEENKAAEKSIEKN